MRRSRTLVIIICFASSIDAACGKANGVPVDAGGGQEAGQTDAGDEVAEEAGPETPPPFMCDPGSRTGAIGHTGSTTIASSTGLKYIVRTPDSYDPTVGSPLIAVFAPAGDTVSALTATDSEFNCGLTPPALAHGYVIAYIGHFQPSSQAAIQNVGQGWLAELQDGWCIDPSRIYLAGHSDGGTTASAITIYVGGDPAIAAIGISAPGLTTHDEDVPLELPMPAFVLQSRDDTQFPGSGRAMADYWGRMNNCDQPGPATVQGDCVPWTNCMADVTYCQGTGPHAAYEKVFNEPMLEFFDAHPLAR